MASHRQSDRHPHTYGRPARALILLLLAAWWPIPYGHAADPVPPKPGPGPTDPVPRPPVPIPQPPLPGPPPPFPSPIPSP